MRVDVHSVINSGALKKQTLRVVVSYHFTKSHLFRVAGHFLHLKKKMDKGSRELVIEFVRTDCLISCLMYFKFQKNKNMLAPSKKDIG